MIDMESLVEKLNLLARPGIVAATQLGVLRLSIVSRSDPERELVVFSATPHEEEVALSEEQIILAFSEFSETAALVIDSTDMGDVVPMTISQKLFNRGLFLNSAGWADAFRFAVTFLEQDVAKWQGA